MKFVECIANVIYSGSTLVLYVNNYLCTKSTSSNVGPICLNIDKVQSMLVTEVVDLPTLLSDIEYHKMDPPEKESYIKEVLRKTLQINPHGVTISQLKELLPFERRTMEKHLEIMKFTNEIYTVPVGSSKLYLPNHKAMHEASSQSARFGTHEYQVHVLKNRLGDFAVIQQRDARKDSQDVTGGLQISLKDYKGFVNYLRKTVTYMEGRGFQ